MDRPRAREARPERARGSAAHAIVQAVRLLGVGRRIAIAPLAGLLLSLARVGFLLAVAMGFLRPRRPQPCRPRRRR